jgi:hypothetical protein
MPEQSVVWAAEQPSCIRVVNSSCTVANSAARGRAHQMKTLCVIERRSRYEWRARRPRVVNCRETSCLISTMHNCHSVSVSEATAP